MHTPNDYLVSPLFMSKSFYIHKKNGTSIHIAAPSQHKHKIKHDKTTMQSSCHAGEAYLA